MKATVSVTNAALPLPAIMFQQDLESAFKQVSDIGYQGVELFLPTAEGVDAQELKALLEQYGLEVGMLAAVGDLVGKDINMGHPDPGVRQTFLDRAPVHLKLASVLGAKVPVGFTRGTIRPGTTKKDVDGWLTESLQIYAKMASDLGVTLVLEPINRYEINYIHRTDEALEIIEAINQPNLKLLLDAFHMNIEEASIPLAIQKAGKRIGHFHFVDNNRWAPGYGHSDMKEIYTCLREAGYQGYLGVEAFPEPDPITAARWGLDYIRMLDRMWDELNKSSKLKAQG